MSRFDDDFRFAEIVHEEFLGPLYAALSSYPVTIKRLPYDHQAPYRGDVIIQRHGLPDLCVEEKASRPLPDGRPHDRFLLELDAPGEPSLRSLKFNDIVVFAMCQIECVDVYLFGARALSNWVFLNAPRCEVRRLFFPGGQDVIVLMIPISFVVQDLGSSAMLYRLNWRWAGQRICLGGGGLSEAVWGPCWRW